MAPVAPGVERSGAPVPPAPARRGGVLGARRLGSVTARVLAGLLGLASAPARSSGLARGCDGVGVLLLALVTPAQRPGARSILTREAVLS